VRERLAATRRSYPRWSHQALLNKVWPNRPIGASAYEMIEIAKEFPGRGCLSFQHFLE